MSVDLNPSQALGLWHSTCLQQVRDSDADLTLRQMTILLQIYLSPPPHTVRNLAVVLDVTKPVISRALDTMGHMGFVKRVRDAKDRRNVLVKRTVDGALYLERLGDVIISEGKKLSV